MALKRAARMSSGVSLDKTPLVTDPVATDDELAAKVIETWQPMFKKQINIAKIHRTRWQQDPFSYGSYANYATGSSKEMVHEFSTAEGNVHFAGEHTSAQDYQTVCGAYESGLRAAEQIIANAAK